MGEVVIGKVNCEEIRNMQTMKMLLTTEQVLAAYIRTGLMPLRGKQAFAVDAEGRDLRDLDASTVAACPIGVMCIAAGHEPFQVETGTFGEYYYDRDNHDGNICWTDGVIHGWEETETNAGYDPKANGYTAKENPEGLEIYVRGYQNGQQLRRDFIKLGFRAA